MEEVRVDLAEDILASRRNRLPLPELLVFLWGALVAFRNHGR